jgi:ribonuclease HI
VTKKRADVELFTDAGVRFGLASWAVVILRKDGRGGIVEASGLLRGEADSYVAEARAIANGLHKARLEKLIGRGESVVVRCDNLGVVDRWRGRVSRTNAPFLKKPRPDLVEAFAVIRREVGRLGCSLELRHVKGHSSIASGDRCSIMNARADFLCSRELGNARARDAGVGVTDRQFEVRSTQLERSSALRRVFETVARLTGRA